MSSQSFADLGVSVAVVKALSDAGITEPFAIQQSVIADTIAGRDVLAQSPTGSGKTLAFGIPLVERIAATDQRPAALVLAPTRELATQIVDEIRGIAHARALRVTAVYGGVGLVKQAKDAARSQVLVATPGRLEDLLARGAFSLENVRVLVLDEADRMLDMGFRPAIDRIVSACPQARQTLLFSATLDGEAGALASRYTRNAVTHKHGPVDRRPNVEIEHRFVSVVHEDRVDALVTELGRPRELALVFVRTKHGADRLVKQLAAREIKAVAMHGNKSQRQREQALSQFESWKVDTLVATDVAARGIDVDDVSHVINFDLPDDSDTYVHRVGRTGRAGRSGIAVTLFSSGQHRGVIELAGALGIEHGLSDEGARRASAQGARRPAAAGNQRSPRDRNRRPANDRSGRQGERPGRPATDHPGRRDDRAGRPASDRSGRRDDRAAGLTGDRSGRQDDHAQRKDARGPRTTSDPARHPRADKGRPAADSRREGGYTTRPDDPRAARQKREVAPSAQGARGSQRRRP
jgi:ATP-dependent RNA helicase RhlE